jgi:hypothetical protein
MQMIAMPFSPEKGAKTDGWPLLAAPRRKIYLVVVALTEITTMNVVK